MTRTTLHIATRDRHSEVTLLLQSLRTQTFQDFDIMVLDDASGTPLTSCYFFMHLANRLRIEGHAVKIFRQEHTRGVCYARNKLIELDTLNNPYVCRLDDDVILEPDYLEKLHHVLEMGEYDLVSGVVPLLLHPEHVRENRFVKPIINEHKFNSEGDLVSAKDDCGYCYIDDETIPTHHFRTNAMYKKKITDEGVRYPDYLSKVGFREEGMFSFQTIMRGYKLAVRTGAIAYHLQCPSGGCRSNTYAKDVQLDDETFRKWLKKNKKKILEAIQ